MTASSEVLAPTGKLMRLSFRVHGTPKPTGSKRAFVNPRTKKAVITENRPKAANVWYNAVAGQAAEAMTGIELSPGPVRVHLHFLMLRPKSHFGTGKNASTLKEKSPIHHIQKPDVDKLTRTVLDAMTGIVWRDDSQIYQVIAEKSWVDKQPGVSVTVGHEPDL